MATIGFVGLGQMGRPMAGHLVADGHEVLVYDRRPDAVAAIEGATGATSVAELGASADVVFLSLPGPEAVLAVTRELETALDPGSIVVDTTTSTPATTRTVADRFAERSLSILGSPVSGGASGATNATLTAMVGGDPAVLESCREFLEAFASNVVHVGPDPGHGHAAKLLNNYLSITAMLATSEAVALGQTVGLDVETMCEVFNASTGRNSATADKFPGAAAGEEVGFSLELLEKDIRLLSSFAEENRLALLLASVVRAESGRALARFGNDGDMTDIYDYVLEASGADRADDDEHDRKRR